LAGDTDITSVDKDALESALLAIDTDITIGVSSSIDTTIAGDLIVTGNDITGGTILNLRSNSSMNFVLDQDTGETGLQFGWWNEADQIASLSELGDLQIDGDLTVSGNKITFGSDAIIEQETSAAALSFGNENGYAFTALTGASLDIYLRSDANEDNADQWKLSVADEGQIDWFSYASGAYVTKLTLDTSGNLTVPGTVNGRNVATDGTKLDGIEASADITDAGNVTDAGALMDSEVTNLADVKAFDTSDYATSAQGTLATNALPKSGGAMTGAITTNSTFDGVDVDACNTLANAALPKAGGDMTGDINAADNVIGFDNESQTSSGTVDVHFWQTGNKQTLVTNGTVTALRLHFPEVSCNILLVVNYGGVHTIPTPAGYEGTGVTTSATIKWAGGTEPTWTETSGKYDIMSFFYDADTNIAYGVASLNF
jgi:hypothetical protein